MTAAPALILNDAATNLANVREAFRAEGLARNAELSAQVKRLADAKLDAVADTRAFRAVETPGALEGDRFPAGERIQLEGPQGLRLTLNEVAHDQMAERIGMPKDFYRRLLAAHPDLVAHNITELLHREADTRLWRMMRPVTEGDMLRATNTGTQLHLRAVLSRSFRPLDNAELLAAVLPEMEARGAYLSQDWSVDERRLHAKFLTMEQSVQEIRARVAAREGMAVELVGRHPRLNGRDISWVDEVVRAGVKVRNSETGFASLSVSAVWEILKCLNGMIAAAATRERHAGKRRQVEGTEELKYLSADAQLLENAATMARVRDAMVDALDEKKQVVQGNLLLAAKAENVTLPAEVPLFQWVGGLAAGLGLTEGEGEKLKEEALHSVQVEGGLTQFAVVQAVTATARQMTDYDRRAEYEATGWQLLEGDTQQLLKMAAEGARARRN